MKLIIMAGDKSIPHQMLSTHRLDHVLVRFDFPPILKLAAISPDGTVSTTKVSPFLAEIQESVKKVLPKYNLVTPKSIVVDVGTPDGPSVKSESDPMAVVHRFSDKDNTIYLEVAYSFFVFGVRGGQYKGFKSFVDRFWPIWEILEKSAGIALLNRVGVRKIDHLVEKGSPDNSFKAFKDRIAPWLLTPFETILSGAPIESVSRLVSQPDSKHLSRNFSFGLRRGFSEGAEASLLFLDFDVFKTIGSEPGEYLKKLLIDDINAVHWQMFTACLSEAELRSLGAKLDGK